MSGLGFLSNLMRVGDLRLRLQSRRRRRWGFEDRACGVGLGSRWRRWAPEMDAGIGDLDADVVIPGLSTGPPRILGISDGGAWNGDARDLLRKEDVAEVGGEEDWESNDSEDDLQIVLNENSGPMGVEWNDDEDEDGEDLVIIVDRDQSRSEMEDQDWGEEAGHTTANEERKEAGDAAEILIMIAEEAGYNFC